MPDIPAPIPEPAPPAPRAVVSVNIALLSDGNVTVTGPIHDLAMTTKIIAQGLSVAADYQSRKEGARLVQAAPAAALRVLNGSA